MIYWELYSSKAFFCFSRSLCTTMITTTLHCSTVLPGTIQVNSVASCGKQCRYGGLMCCRKSRVLLSAPLYNYFITFLMVCVFLLSVSFLLQTVTNNIVLAANLKVIETVIQAMLLVDSIHKILAIGWEPFTHDFWYVWRNLPPKKALCVCCHWFVAVLKHFPTFCCC